MYTYSKKGVENNCGTVISFSILRQKEIHNERIRKVIQKWYWCRTWQMWRTLQYYFVGRWGDGEISMPSKELNALLITTFDESNITKAHVIISTPNKKKKKT